MDVLYISCYHAQHCQPTRGFQLRDIREPPRGRLETRVNDHPSPNRARPHTRSASPNSLGVVALAEKTVDTANRERKTGLGGSRLGCFASRSFSSRLSSRHDFVRLRLLTCVKTCRIKCAVVQRRQKGRWAEVDRDEGHNGGQTSLFILPASRNSNSSNQQNYLVKP